jgi:uncharacterized protein YjbJ (UPF0337 family)
MDQPGSSDQLVPKETEATAKAADIVPALKEEAGKLANKSVAGGAEAAQAVGKAAESAAQVLDDALPALAGYVRNAAGYTNKFADDLRDKKAEELLSEAMAWTRQQPLLTMAGAALLGFALSRVVKAGAAPDASASPSSTESGNDA